MAIGTATAIGLGAAALGGWMSTRNKNKQAQRQEQYGRQQAQNFQGMMQTGPSALEQQGAAMMGGMTAPTAYNPQQVAGPSYTPEQFNAAGALGGFGFNTGQDALMQSLRTDPTQRSNTALQSIIGGQGNPFDTSALFQALGVMDQRATNTAVAQTRAGASGLGQRFGSYMARQEGDMRLRANEAAAARNAQIQMQSHGDAQQRLLQSIGMLSGNEQFGAQNRLAAAGQLQQGALGAGNLQLGGVQANNAAQAQLAAMQQQAAIANQGAGLQAAGLNQQGQLTAQGQQMDALRTLMAAEQARTGQNVQLAGMAAGVGAPVGRESYGALLGGLGSAITMPGVLQSTRPNYNLMVGYPQPVLR